MNETETLGDQSRNYRQKSVLLREVGRLRCNEVSAAVETSKRVVEESKKLCGRSEPPTSLLRKSK